jgi:thiol-disulfide isomerase/thioredoxin
MACTANQLLLVGLLGVSAVAQNRRVECAEPKNTYKLGLPEVQARIDAGSDDFFLYKRLLDLTPSTPRAGTLAPLFEKKLKEHPEEPLYLYLYGRSLIGVRTPEALVQLKRVVELAPDFPWTYLEFARIYTSRNFADAKLAASVHTYRELCPASLDGYNWARNESESVKNAEWVRNFRNLLEKSAAGNNHMYWTDLWATEFRLAPKSDYAQLRERVAEVLKRLEKVPEPSRAMMADLATGYRLTERPEAAEKIEQRLDPNGEAHKADQALMKDTNWSGNLNPEERETAFRELARRAAEWVEKWPESSTAWEQLLMSLPHTPGWTKEQLERAGEGVLKADAAIDLGWSHISEPLKVAQRWVKYGIRPQECVAIAEKALDQISLGPEVRSDLVAQPNEAQRQANELYGFNHSLWDAMSVIVDGSIQLKEFDKARNMIGRMARWVSDNQALADNRANGFDRFRGMWLNSEGELAEAEGRKMDAVALYVRAIALRAQDPDAAKHARELWDEMGGTGEGWASATAVNQVPVKPVAAKVTVTAAFQFAPWNSVNKALNQMSLEDVRAKTWTLTDLRGKTTLVTAWATWCGPCREELPSIQKLYELTKDRDDIEVITLNLDEDPGLVEPFLAAYHYTFPVLMSARVYAAQQATEGLVIPQNWLVDRTLILREKSAGFDSTIPDWPKAMLDKLASIRQ